MMSPSPRVILFGATGNLGRAIATELAAREYDLTVVCRTPSKASLLAHLPAKTIIADPSMPESLQGILQGQDIIISALGKSVSPASMDKPGFRDVDYQANLNILQEAVKAGTKKFVYVSAFHAEKYPHLEYFRSHQDMADELMRSGMEYVIIKPPALFSAFTDMIIMARKGRLAHLGTGDRKTNPIDEKDLAAILVESLDRSNANIEAGGKHIYTRRQINEIIQHAVDPSKKVRTIPLWLIRSLLPVLKLASRNTYHKFAFFIEVMQQDTIAPQLGENRLEDYVADLLAKEKHT